MRKLASDRIQFSDDPAELPDLHVSAFANMLLSDLQRLRVIRRLEIDASNNVPRCVGPKCSIIRHDPAPNRSAS